MPAVAVTNNLGQINQGDTAELVAYLRINEQAVTADQIVGVNFIVQEPAASSEAPAIGPNTSTVAGTVQDDGSGFYRWTDTTNTGEYLAQAQFTLVTGEIRSVVLTFTVVDPFNPPLPSNEDWVVEQVQLRLEDCFDSVEGGPWLRDKTRAHFDYSKIADFIPEALLDINVQMPPTEFTLEYFTTPTNTPGETTSQFMNPNLPLLVKGVLVLTIRHLMRSYTEQPIPQGGNVTWSDRTRYQQMWTQIYSVEYADYIEKVRLWKRTTLQLGHSALLTLSKAGRLYPYGSQRSRGIWRGYY